MVRVDVCAKGFNGCRIWCVEFTILCTNILNLGDCSGNPLETCYRPCKAAAEGLFSTMAITPSTHPNRPSGLSYWHNPPSPSPMSTCYIYTCPRPRPQQTFSLSLFLRLSNLLLATPRVRNLARGRNSMLMGIQSVSPLTHLIRRLHHSKAAEP